MLSSFSHVQLFLTLWTVAHQAPLFLRFSRQEYESGFPCPLLGGSSQLKDQTLVSYVSPTLAGWFLTTGPPGKSSTWILRNTIQSIEAHEWSGSDRTAQAQQYSLCITEGGVVNATAEWLICHQWRWQRRDWRLKSPQYDAILCGDQPATWWQVNYLGLLSSWRGTEIHLHRNRLMVWI